MTEPRLRPDQVSAMLTMLTDAIDHDASVAARSRVRSSRVETPGTRPSRGTHSLRRGGFVVLGIGAVAAVAAAVTIVVPRFTPADPSADASEMLRAAADATAAPELADGQYLKLETRAGYLATTSVDGQAENSIGYLEAQLRAVYVPSDASGQRIAHSIDVEPTVFFGDGAQEFAAERREATSTALGSGPAVPVPVSDETQPVTDLTAMPLDPEALLVYLESFQYQAGSVDENTFSHVVDLLRAGDITADLRSALYQTLALMPAVVITEQRAHLDGRVGTAIGLRGSEGDTRQEIIIEPSSGEYIGVRLVTIDGFGEIPPGTPLEYTALSTTVVNSVPR